MKVVVEVLTGVDVGVTLGAIPVAEGSILNSGLGIVTAEVGEQVGGSIGEGYIATDEARSAVAIDAACDTLLGVKACQIDGRG